MAVPDEPCAITLSLHDLREVTGYAAGSAQQVLSIFERAHPENTHPRDAIDAAWTFARGGDRGKRLRDTAWAALRAARGASTPAASSAAQAAMSAAGAAYLHPLADPHQVKHILGAAAYAARAFELVAGDDHEIGTEHIERECQRASVVVVGVLLRYPAAPSGGGRVGELIRLLDASLRRPR